MGADQCRALLQIPKGKDWGRGGSPLVSFEQASHIQKDPRYKVDQTLDILMRAVIPYVCSICAKLILRPRLVYNNQAVHFWQRGNDTEQPTYATDITAAVHSFFAGILIS